MAKYVKVFLPSRFSSIIFKKNLKEFMIFIKDKKFIPFNNMMININSIIMIEEIDY